VRFGLVLGFKKRGGSSDHGGDLVGASAKGWNGIIREIRKNIPKISARSDSPTKTEGKEEKKTENTKTKEMITNHAIQLAICWGCVGLGGNAHPFLRVLDTLSADSIKTRALACAASPNETTSCWARGSPLCHLQPTAAFREPPNTTGALPLAPPA
jgi:hypothetical protein